MEIWVDDQNYSDSNIVILLYNYNIIWVNFSEKCLDIILNVYIM